MESTRGNIIQLTSHTGPNQALRKSELHYDPEYKLLFVKFPYNASVLIKLAKELGGRWRDSKKAFAFAPYLCYANAIEEALPRLEKTEEYTEWKDTAQVAFDELRIPAHLQATWDKLYSFQQEAVQQLVANPYGHAGSLLALSPGLGKTVVFLMAAAILDLDRVLIVAPLSLLEVWQKEFLKWGGRKVFRHKMIVCHGERPDLDNEGAWVVTNYNTVTSPKHSYEYWEVAWDLVGFDESVLVKNRKTTRFVNVKNLCQSSDRIWLLSGSPITRHPDDLWSQFHLIDPRAFPSYWRFTKRFCSVSKNIWAPNKTNVDGANDRDFHRDFGDLLFVKNQEQVLPDLPEMRIEPPLNISMTALQEKIYNDMLKKFLSVLDTGEELTAMAKLAQLTRLQQITSNPCNFGDKWPDTSGKHLALLEQLEAESLEFPLLIWTHWRPGAEALYNKLRHLKYNVEMISGGMDVQEVNDKFEDYKTGKTDILILSLGVGKFGHTLINTRTVVYMDKTWNADDFVQSLFRVKRIGLTHSPRVISLTCPGTIDDMIEDNLAGKFVSIAHITNGDLGKMLRMLNRQSYLQNGGAA